MEFALVLPLFILILVGIFDFGRAIYAYNTIQNAARQAVRLAIVDQNTTAITDVAVNHATGLIDATGVTVEFYDVGTDTTYSQCSDAATGCELGWTARITVTYEYQAATPIIGNLVGTITMHATSEQGIESVHQSP